MAKKDEMTKEEAVKFCSEPFGKAMREVTASYVSPIYWQERNDEDGIKLRNGTMFFLDAGEGPFAVTARHVYQGFRAAKNDCPEATCQLGNLPFDLIGRLISQHELEGDGPDIATFRVEPEEVAKLGKNILTGSQNTWPPSPPQQGKGVFFAGFPGQDRVQITANEIVFGVFHGGLTATSVNDRNICCQIDPEYLVEAPWGDSAPFNYDIGGVSGAPLLTLVDDDGVWSWRLGGVIYTAHKDLGMMFAARADFILPDGSVKPYDWTQRRKRQT